MLATNRGGVDQAEVVGLLLVFILIGGYDVAASPAAARAIEVLARLPRSGRGAVSFVALLSMLVSLLHWGLSLIFSGLHVRALARREDLRLDYRAAGAAGYLGASSVWALGLSSSAALLQANPARMPPALLAITGEIPFTETVFLGLGVPTEAAQSPPPPRPTARRMAGTQSAAESRASGSGRRLARA